jgi:hypothetical protein
MKPEWKTSRNAALAAWRETLTPAQLAEYDQAKTDAKAAVAARRAARAERNAAREAWERRIMGLVFRGQTTEEIAAAIGASNRSVRRCYARLGVERGAAGYRRVPVWWVKLSVRAQIDQVASELGVGVEETIERLLTYAFEEDALHARRLLRVTRPNLRRVA